MNETEKARERAKKLATDFHTLGLGGDSSPETLRIIRGLEKRIAAALLDFRKEGHKERKD